MGIRTVVVVGLVVVVGVARVIGGATSPSIVAKINIVRIAVVLVVGTIAEHDVGGAIAMKAGFVGVVVGVVCVVSGEVAIMVGVGIVLGVVIGIVVGIVVVASVKVTTIEIIVTIDKESLVLPSMSSEPESSESFPSSSHSESSAETRESSMESFVVAAVGVVGPRGEWGRPHVGPR